MTRQPGPDSSAPKEDGETQLLSSSTAPAADAGGQDQAGGESALTCIPPMYTLATHTGPDSEEADAIIIRNFLETIAGIALSVASRTVNT